MRDRFTFEENYLTAINELDDKLQLRVYKAIAHYALRDELPDLVGIAKAVFALIKPQIDANIRKSDNGKKGAGFGKLGGRPKKEETPRKPLNNPLGVSDKKPLNNPLGVLEKETENEKEKQEKERTKEKEIKEKDKEKEKDLLPPLIPPMGDETKKSENRVLKIDLSDPNQTTKEKEKVEFDVFWDKYDKKVGDKEKLKKKWDKLPLDIQNKILEYIPQYIESQPDKKFRKNPQTFLNQKSWEDELILHTQVYKTNQITYADF